MTSRKIGRLSGSPSRSGVSGGTGADFDATGALPAIYRAAIDEAEWQPLLRRLADAFGSPFAVLVTINKRRDRAVSLRLSDPDAPSARRRVQPMESYPAEDDLLYLATRDDPPGTTHLCHERVGPDTLRKSPLHELLLKPRGVSEGIGGILENDEHHYTCCGFWFPRLTPAMERLARSALEALLPHLAAAVRVNRRLSEARRAQWASLNSMQFSRHGILLLNFRGQVTFVNREAERIVRSRDGIALAQRRAVFADTTAQGNYDQVVGGPADLPSGGVEARFRAARRSRRLPYDVLVLPRLSRSGYGRVRAGTAFIVVVSDPAEVFAIAKSTLTRHYGLTATEAQLCRALIGRGDLAAAAVDCGIALNTARTHLKRIFTKLRVSSQFQLMQWLGSSIRPPTTGAAESLLLNE